MFDRQDADKPEAKPYFTLGLNRILKNDDAFNTTLFQEEMTELSLSSELSKSTSSMNSALSSRYAPSPFFGLEDPLSDFLSSEIEDESSLPSVEVLKQGSRKRGRPSLKVFTLEQMKVENLSGEDSDGALSDQLNSVNKKAKNTKSKRERNKESAQASRKRKAAQKNAMELKMDELVKENLSLRQENLSLRVEMVRLKQPQLAEPAINVMQAAPVLAPMVLSSPVSPASSVVQTGMFANSGRRTSRGKPQEDRYHFYYSAKP